MAITPTQAITKAQYFKTSCAPYTAKGFARCKRHWSYVNSGGTIPFIHKASATAAVCVGAAAGGVYGARRGYEAGKALTDNSRVITLSTGVGFTIGASIGAGGGLYVYICAAERLPYHNDWKEKEVNKVLKDAIISDGCNDDVLKDFLCPMGLVVMDWPTRTPSGHSYEKMEILKYRAGSNTIKDPMRNRVFDETELQDDFESAFIIHKRTVYLLTAYSEQINDSPLLKKGIDVLIKDFQILARFAFEDSKSAIEERRTSSGNVQRYMQELQDFFATFGNTPADDVNWTVNWKAKLNERWAYFNPNAVILDN